MRHYFFLILLLSLESTLFAYFEREKASLAAHSDEWDSAHHQHLALMANGYLDSETLYDTGVCAYKVGDYEHAINYFDRVTHASDASDQLKHASHYNCGNAHAMLSDYQKSAEQYEQALLYDPDDQAAKDNLEIVKKMQENQDNQQDQNKSSSGNDQSEQNNQNNQSKEQQDPANQDDQTNDDAQNQDKNDSNEQNNESNCPSESQKNPDNQPQAQDQSEQSEPEETSDTDNNEQDKGQPQRNASDKQNEKNQSHNSDAKQKTGSDEPQDSPGMPEVENPLNSEGQEPLEENNDEEDCGFFGQTNKEIPAWITDLLEQQDEEDTAINRELALRHMESENNHDTYNNW